MIEKFVPAFGWLKTYKRTDLREDLSAGVIVAIMLIPQGMAYAMLAGLPPVYGLYASLLPMIAYALFGSSRQLAVGPVAMISLLVFAGVSPFADPGSEQYIRLVLLLTLIVGVIQLLLGLFRFGFFINFISHAVISGFTSAAAIIILLSQLGHLFRINLSGGHSAIHLLGEILKKTGEIHPMTLALGLASIGILFFFKKRSPNFPAPLLVVIAGTLTVYFLKLDHGGLKIVGHVPKGFPGFSAPPVDIESVLLLFPTALTVLFVGFMESISIAKSIAMKEKYKIDSNQELKGLGLANIAASLFSAYPVTGGFSRTAVNYQAGARTRLASIFTAALIFLTLIFLTPFFYYLPNPVLAAIVIVAVMGLIDLKGARHLFKIKKSDGWILLITFGAAFFLGSKEGILIGMTLSLLVFIWRSAHPHTAELGYLEQEGVFRNVERFPEARSYPETLILRVDASLYFANMAFLEDLLRKKIAEKSQLKWVVMDFPGVNDIDAVAIDTLEEIMDDYKGIQFLFTEMKGPVRDLAARAGWEEKYGNSMKYPSIRHAIQQIRQWQGKG